MTRRRPIALATLLSAALLVTGCGSSGDEQAPPATTTTAPEAVARLGTTATDLADRRVALPATVDRALAVHPIPSFVLWRLAPEKQVGVDRVFKMRWIDGKGPGGIAPDAVATLRKKPVTPVYFMGLDSEQLLKLRPDVILTMRGDGRADAVRKQTGIPFFALAKAPLASYADTIRQTGAIVGNAELAERMATFWTSTIDDVAKRAAGDDGAPTTVFYTGQSGEPGTTPGSETVFGSIITTAGGRNVADALPDATNEGSEVSPEQVATWDPDIVIAQTTAVKEQLEQDERWSSLRAVREKKIYVPPALAMLDGINAVMGLAWTREILEHGDEAQAHAAIEPRLREFYELFYDRRVEDDELGRPAAG